MITRRRTMGLLAAAALTVGGCSLGEAPLTLRYKMIVSVETPQGVRTGSSVRALVYSANDSWFPFGESRPGITMRGEAVAVDLPNGQTLFALLTGGDGDVDYASRIADRSGIWSANKSTSIGPVTEVWPTAPKTEGMAFTSPIPMLVTFKDIRDPKSVIRVNPDDLAVTFGAGIKLRAITVQVTDEPVIKGIAKRLAWLPNYYDKMLDGDGLNRSKALANNLSQNSFQQGNAK
jgi:hypothetical protein